MENVKRAILGSPDNPLRLGREGLEIPCYVLEDGTRVLSGRGMQNALGLGQSHGTKFKELWTNKAITPYINNELAMVLQNPLRFIRPGRGGKIALGFEATILPDICNAVLEARERGVLSGSQLLIAKQCEILARALAKVGIIALIDEVTGYEKIRDRDALQKILDKYLTDEWAKWTKTFPDEYYQELFRLNHIDYPPRNMKKPSYIGHWTNDLIYSRLAPGVIGKLREMNPTTETGHRKRKHHQYFTRDIGHPKLKEHLDRVIYLMKSCTTWRDFLRRLNRASPKYINGTMQTELPLNVEYKDDSLE
jgi:hypothetical protein